MYESFYHLKEQPFGSTPDPRFFYKSIGHRKALAYLAYGVFRKRGFLALTGEVGVGKTTVIRAFVHTFAPALEVAFIINTKVTFDELLYLILRDFGREITDMTKVGMLDALNSFLIERFSQNRNLLIVIDEAQNLSPELLEELRMLSNLETDSEKLLQIALVGQPELEEILLRRELRQLNQRIPGILRIHTLRPTEVGEYILCRLRTAGLSNGRVRFTDEAHQAIYEYSSGVPRLINMICERVLMQGYLLRTGTIDENMVRNCVEELWAAEERKASEGGAG